MSTPTSPRNVEAPTPLRRTRSANDLDTLPRNAAPAMVSDTSADSGSREAEASTSNNPQPPPQSASGPSTSWTFNIGMDANTQGQPASPAGVDPFAGQGPIRRFFSSIGVGRGATPERKTQMSLIWNLSWGFAQVVTISTLVGLTGTIWKNPDPDSPIPQTEWEACDRPLGVWAILWVLRVILASGLAYWEYKRTVAARAAQQADTEGAAATANNASAPTAPVASPRPNAGTPFQTASATNAAYPMNSMNATSNHNSTNVEPITLPHNHLYARLSMCSSLITLSWFLTAHIIQYTSLNTCRYTSPHLWWLTFGILCIMYLMVLEVILLGFIVLVVAPILFVFWNIFLFCIGRHPAQNPHMIKPDIGKLSKSLVDRIPLVMYIPPPPILSGTNKESTPTDEPQHEYPPTSPTNAQQPSPPTPPKRNRFRFFKKKPSKEADKAENLEKPVSDSNAVDLEVGKTEQEVWEGHFEKGEYPFVVLEGNRAACAICLMDFEAPKLKIGETEVVASSAANSSSSTAANTPARSPDQTGESSSSQLKLEDAGEGAQPLRLLACGHVFHQTCLDPWLTDVSGRCPVCQRPVEISELKKRKRRFGG
ncbi:hypothetical protein FA15DRAFT_672988 [Coprinopsis marcescibilis]|uniref:RING-type domain-containing protein n=1 Tax=Coprinopsis marcescibilis TaxID=230819 RepID=A0A5C3KL11_COPMA|nr:hypothetical protein FA15DRAFT_672988 [Coprinopsis marcescibilis]